MEKALELSRYCVPFTPFKRKLEESLVCLVSTAGVRVKADAPFNLEGDNSFKRIDGSLSAIELAVDDTHYDHGCIDKDVNCVFPIDRLRSLARPNDEALQKWILMDTLELLLADPKPGEVIIRDYT